MAKKNSTRKPEAPPSPPPMKASERPNEDGPPPPGFTLRHTLRGHTNWLFRIAWSRNGRFLATPSEDRTVRVWDADTGKALRTLQGHTNSVYSVSWSPDGRLLASAGGDHTVRVWDTNTGKHLRTLERYTDSVFSVSWSPDGWLLASAGGKGIVRVWDADTGKALRTLQGHTNSVYSVSWSPDGRLLASAGSEGTIWVWNADTGKALRTMQGHTEPVRGVSWSPDGRLLASAGHDTTVRIWDADTGKPLRTLEGHTGPIRNAPWSPDGRLLASKSADGTVRLWRTDTWVEVAVLPESSVGMWPPGLAFHPSRPVLATLGEEEMVVRIWDLDIDVILGHVPAAPTIAYTSAKIVLLGESIVGKSWLAIRLLDRRQPKSDETGTTHGMKIWKQDAGTFHPAAPPPPNEEREVFLWDFGGQDEYQLVHQMFLHDTTLALILIDPTRGQAEREKAREWNLRLTKQLGTRQVVKLLVGAKVDTNTQGKLIDRAAIDRLCEECEFKGFFESSAKSGRKIDELRAAVADAIDWSAIGRTTRRELFQRIREEVDARRDRGEIVVPLREFNDTIRAKYPTTFDEGAAGAVTDQLAGQGLLAKTRLKGGDEAVILRVDVVERYAGSFVVLARDNPRGVPALQEVELGTRQTTLPGMGDADRLPWPHERVVLECVVELMIRHGICFRHQGLLVFPTLFKEPPTEAEAEQLPHAVTLWYDFTGAIDNVYASLVAGLMVLQPFGPGRLTAGKAEFEDVASGLCGLRRIRRPGGLAHIDLFFGPRTSQARRDEFTAYVEAHLREHGVEITEYRAIKCPQCGRVIPEEMVRDRVTLGKADVVCVCDRRTPISAGVVGGMAGVRERDPQTDAKVFALRQRIKKRLALESLFAKLVIVGSDPDAEGSFADLLAAQGEPASGPDDFTEGDTSPVYGSALDRGTRLTARDIAEVKAAARVAAASAEDGACVRLLHLSDLHFTPDTQWEPELNALLNDLRHEDLGSEVIHHLVVSGDFVDRGNPRAFPVAREFVSALRAELGISIERVVLVPGNHDVVDSDDFYQWKSTAAGLKKGEYLELDKGVLARNPERWPERFKPFSDHLYHPLFQQPYPLPARDQGQGFPPENTGVQFLAFNSAWAIDQTDRKRAGMYKDAVLGGIKAAEAHAKARPAPRPPLRVAVWHHAVMHVEGMKNVEFVGHLTKAGVRLVLHGDVHEANPATNPFQWEGLVMLGAGTFGAVRDDRPESVPRLYQVIELMAGKGPGGFEWARVYTRARAKADGPWDGWYNWRDPAGGKGKVACFDVDLNTGGPRKPSPPARSGKA